MIKRLEIFKEIQSKLKQFSVVALLGARQVGKSSLAREFSTTEFYDLENPVDLRRLENPQIELENKKGLIVIDEIQRRPDLFPYLRYLTDYNKKIKFLILGSASPTLLKQSSETLAGRISFQYLSPFSLFEVPQKYQNKIWLRGGFPRSLLAPTDFASFLWRKNYIQTFLERDIPNLGIRVPASTLDRFWNMLAHNHGQILNITDLARSFGMSEVAIRNYLEILESTFMITLLKPWHENISKRQIKRPKIYFQDSGLLHNFLQIQNKKDLSRHIKLGASWEGFVIHEILQKFREENADFYFWAVHSGAELDLLKIKGQKKIGYEIKYSDAPALTLSMTAALKELKLEKLLVIYPGHKSYKLAKNIEVLPLSEINNKN